MCMFSLEYLFFQMYIYTHTCIYAYNVFYLFKWSNCLNCWGGGVVNLGEISMHYLISKEQSFQVSRLKAVKKPNIYRLLKVCTSCTLR